MAQSRKKGASGGRASARSSSRKARPSAEVEVVEEETGYGFEEGVIFVTTLLLIVAFVMVDKARGAYGEGLFF